MRKIAKTLIDAKILDRALAVGVLCEAGFVLAAISALFWTCISACSPA